MHCDETGLALLAVGQPAPSAVFERHSQTCPACHQRLVAMTEAVTVAQASLAERAYLQPPAAVWRSIAAAAGAPGGTADLVVRLPEREGAVAEVEHRSAAGRPMIIAAIVVLLAVVAVLLWVFLS